MGSTLVKNQVYILCSTLVTGGAEMVVSYLARGLPDLGYPVEVLCIREPGEVGEKLMAQGARLTSGISSGRFDLTATGRLSRMIRKGVDPVLISLDHHDAMFIGSLAKKMAGVRRSILSVHSTGLWGKSGTFSFSDRLVLPSFDRLVALSSPHADFIENDGKISRERITIVPNGIDTVRFRPASPGEKESERAGLSIPRGSFVVTIVAALRPEKNHAMFLESAARLASIDERFHFLIVGDGAEAEKLHQKAEGLIGSGRLQMLGVREDVEKILRASDASVLCSFPVVETFPMTVLEAMATGLPVVSTEVGSISSMLSDGREGFLIESGNTGSLVSRLEVLAADADKAAEIGARARERVVGDYSESVMVNGYSRLIDSLR